MTIKRAVDETPTFSLIDDKDAQKRVIHEILKVKPRVEISIEGSGELALARITDWEPARKFFVVKWSKKSDTFEEKLESESGLRAFFKVTLFSKVIVFKSTTLRRMDDGTYHYRVPEQFYQQQRRQALRVPLEHAMSAYISTPIGNFEILDMSVSGARLKTPSSMKKTFVANSVCAPVNLSVRGHPELKAVEFSLKITHTVPGEAGCKFQELTKPDQALIKQFLINALHVYFEKHMKKSNRK